jgi:hypothetical protein
MSSRGKLVLVFILENRVDEGRVFFGIFDVHRFAAPVEPNCVMARSWEFGSESCSFFSEVDPLRLGLFP